MSKYIIELDEKIFEVLIKYGEPLPTGNTFHDSILKAVANGKPYHCTSELISRSGLIKDMQTELGLHDEENGSEPLYMEALVDVYNLIKKTPEVPILTQEDLLGSYEKGLDVGYALAEKISKR